ncbi:chromate transporter [Clostridioides sp. ES-S-0001-03]|uniref:chromate transporter n=1 Tax=Clostridioides sp. ES-S-0001-03 TaxID=2770771 RepID=UPI001D0C169E|nr:chromate transporter [Clostridioides sp. ES-S-0001-03]
MIINLFFTFLKIGMFSIGGGYAIIPIIQEQVVFKQGWITQKVFTDIITISQMTPGPLAVNTSTFVGMQVAGIEGAISATVGCIISGITISMFLYGFFKKYKSSKFVFEILNGLKASSLGLIISAGFTIILLTFFGSSNYYTTNIFKNIDIIAVILFCCSLYCLRKYKIGPILMMVLSGLFALIVYL